MNRRWRSRA